MANNTCPKCGAEEGYQEAFGRYVWRCGTTQFDDGTVGDGEACRSIRLERADAQLAAMTERAEKAEALLAEKTEQLARAESLASRWKDDAAMFARNADFYGGLIRQIGDMLGPETRRADDGSLAEDVLALRVPEVLADTLARAEKAEALAQYRLEALEARDRVCAAEHSMDMHGQEVATRCRYCDSWPGDCLSDCPTVTHPKEGQP